MKTLYYPNKIKSHLVTIVRMAPFTLKSTSNLRYALHFRYSLVIRRFIPSVIPLNSNNHGFDNIFDYNHIIYSDYLVCTGTDSAQIILMIICDIIVIMKVRSLYSI